MKIIKDVRALTLCGGFGAISFVIMWGLGSFLLIATGIPLVGGIASSIVNAFVLIIGILLINRFGAATLISLTLTTLTIPTVIFGPPGVYKILLGLYMGGMFEIFLVIFKRIRWIYPLGAGLTFAASVPMEYWLFKILGFPAADKIKPLIFLIMAIYFVNALLGSWLGMRFYDKKISKLNAVQMWKGRSESTSS
jgi:hypothetical protein